MEPIKVFTAFSGYDSQCLALESIGVPFDLIGWSEIDKYAIKAHNALFPQYADRNFGDISQIDWSQVPDFDLFTYSSPCQDFSQAGKQAGGERGSNTRSSLLWECERAIETKKPKYLLMENVAALVSKKFIKLFNNWQLLLERLGYTNFTQVLNATKYGYPEPVAQNRERVFMISVLNADKCFYFPDAQPLTKRISDYLEPVVDEKYYVDDAILDKMGIVNCNGDSGVKMAGNLQPDNNRKESKVIRSQNQVIRSDGTSLAIQSKYNHHAFKIQVAGNIHPGQNGTLYDTDGIFPTIRAGEGVKTQTKIVERTVLGWTRDKDGEIVNCHPVEVANTVTALKRANTQNYVMEPQVLAPVRTKEVKERRRKGIDKYSGRVQDNGNVSPALTCNTENYLRRIENDFRVRRLTPRECFRLMGVSEAHIDTLMDAKISNTQLYHLAGNSIVVNCLAAIFRQLFIENSNKHQQTEIF